MYLNAPSQRLRNRSLSILGAKPMQISQGHLLNFAKRWVVVNTQPHRERAALDNLVRQGFEPYCPMVKKVVRHARKSQELLRPLFPSYLFVRVSPEAEPWRPILSTTGVRTVIRNGDQLSFIDSQFIDGLKTRESAGVITHPVRQHQVGETVRLQGGAFDGLIAKIIEMDDKDRLVVLMDLLNRPVKVSINSGQIDPLY